MKKLIAALILSLSACGGTPASAYELEIEDYFTNGSMGCMMMRECTKDVKEVKSIKDIEDYQRKDHSLIANEFNDVLKAVNDVGINVYIAPMEYFLIGTRGVYYTDGNNIFLNADMVERSTSLISTFRHEGWHAVQDCMAGDIKNSFIAIVYPQDKVPKYLQAITENTYGSSDKLSSIVWEKEAYWAGYTEGMTQTALEACKTGKMWEMYPPTPMTREFLVEKGFIKE